ncbi:sugar-phosphatase [Clostridium weizhouense]|uniref:Sugar-phosphatase n=1 Tax=Clostridium weizhouense TaxID=2859781 RepID=A0ABS7AKL8_9CLOT|nr:sugar-phosphatase [Clostridium weizhouense]MBW6409205.1 sugar-phosphatase [Clostridium weizhouense]
MYKLIAIDMDGTLLTTDKKISERNKEAIKKAEEKGVKVVLTSGRPIEGLIRYLKELELLKETDYVISFNGSMAQNVKTKEIIFKSILKGYDLKYITNIADNLGINILAFSPTRGLITPKINKYTDHEAEMDEITYNVVDFNTIDDEEDIIKLMMIDPEPILEEALRKMPKEIYKRYSMCRSTPFYLEIMHKNVSKGEGIKKLSQMLGINRDEIITFGDAANDLSMIKYAGLGIAMGNAFTEVKEVADFITKTNDEDGVAYAIEKFILEK